MSDREKLIELLWTHPCAGIDCATCERLVEVDCDTAALADKLLANGVTFAKDTDNFGKCTGCHMKEKLFIFFVNETMDLPL